MVKTKIALSLHTLLALAISAALPASSYAGSAARVDFSIGDVTASTPDGSRRNLVKGGEVSEGELISTNNGRAQLRFADGAYMSLQPQTEFKIDQYTFDGKAEGAEKAVFSLIKGGLRTITGIVGRRNRQDYMMRTMVATIGIRGTEYSVMYGNSITVAVGGGAIEACNAGGCRIATSGQTLYVENANTMPVIVSRKTELPPAPPPQQSNTFVIGEVLGPGGTSIVLPTAVSAPVVPVVPPVIPVVPPAIPVIPLASGAGGMGMAAITTGGTFGAGLIGGTLTFAPSGALTQFTDCCVAANNFTSGVSTDFGADGIIAWGRWDSGVGLGGASLITMNYVANLSANAVTAPNIIRGYASFASTAPTVTMGGSLVAVGTPNSVTGTLNVNFPNLASGGTLTYALNIPVAGQTFNVNGNANQFAGTGFLGTSSTITSTGAGCTPSCAGNIPFGNAIQGAFTGTSAQRAGANYGFTSSIGQVSGAVVFR